MTPDTRPLPVLNPETRRLFEYTLRGELPLQRCAACDGYRFIPRVLCDHCGSPEWNWTPAQGGGQLISFARVHKVFHPGFADRTPYWIGIVELDEGPRITSALTVRKPWEESLAAGMRVVLELERRTPEIYLPRFRVTGVEE